MPRSPRGCRTAASMTRLPRAVSRTIVPRRSSGSGLRSTRPASARRSRRLVVPPDESIVACVRSEGRSSPRGPERRSAASRSNHPGWSPCCASPSLRVDSARRTARNRRPNNPIGATSRSGRSLPHCARMRSMWALSSSGMVSILPGMFLTGKLLAIERRSRSMKLEADTTEIGSVMRAVRLHAPRGTWGLILEEIDTPHVLDGEALVRVHAAAITRDELGWATDRLRRSPRSRCRARSSPSLPASRR